MDPLVILVMIVCTFLGAVGQLFFKRGALTSASDVLSIIFNVNTIAGAALYGTSMILYIYALKHGSLSMLAPIISLTYLWTCIMAVIFLGESMTMTRWIGLALIMLGVALIAK